MPRAASGRLKLFSKEREMEKELARRRVFERAGLSLDDILCLHATSRASFSRDPVFPDSVDTSEVAEASPLIFDVSARIGDEFVDLAYKREPQKHGKKKHSKNEVDGRERKPERYSVKIRKRVYDRVAKLYTGTQLHSDLWLAIYRYETLGLFSGMSGAVPPRVYRALAKADKRAVECFSSFFNATIPGYYGLFPDIERPFGCRGNFFAIKKMKSLMLCNPPFERCVMNAFVGHVLKLLESSKGQCLAILPAFDVDHRKLLNASKKCKSEYPVDYETDVFTETLRASPFTKWSGLFCKDSFAYVDMASSKTVHYTSTLACFLSSLDKPRPRVLEEVRRALPRPDISSIGRGNIAKPVLSPKTPVSRV